MVNYKIIGWEQEFAEVDEWRENFFTMPCKELGSETKNSHHRSKYS